MRHIPALDGLRAIAVLAVVAYHAGVGRAGFVGVDVFFVISGYLITRLLRDEVLATGRIDFWSFYARRARRLLPALAVVIAVTLVAGAFLLSPTGPQQALFRSAAWSSLFAGNLYFQRTGYFDGASEEMPLLHLWSLGVEEQFYLLFPILLLGLMRTRHPRAWLAGVSVASFVLAEWLLRDGREAAAFYQMPARFWELAAGSLIALSPAMRHARELAWSGLALVLAAVVVPPASFPGLGALPAVAGSALLVAGLHSGYQPAPLAWRPMVFVGLISYSLYLWHWPMLALNRAYQLGEPLWQERAAIVATAFGLAWLSWRFVEKPARIAKVPAPRAVAAGATVSIALAAITAAAATMPTATIALPGGVRIDPQWRELYACHWGEKHRERDFCGSGRVMLWGDSHAMAWKPLAESMGAITQLTMDGCPPSADYGSAECRAFNAEALQRLQSARVVVIAARWTKYGESLHPSFRDAIKRLPADARIVVIGPTPELKKPAADCLSRGLDCAPSRTAFDALAAPERRFLQSLPVEYLEPADFFCGPAKCLAARDGFALFLDRDHVSPTAARTFAESL